MDRYLVRAPRQENPRPPLRPRWERIIPEIEGRITTKYRRESSRLLVDSYVEASAIVHSCSSEPTSPSYMARARSGRIRDEISDLEFDSKGIYLAAVTKSGCLTVYDFETLYCSTYGSVSGLLDEKATNLLHIPNCVSFDVVRWNPANQDEVVCSSRQSDSIHLFDISYISSEPHEVLRRRRFKSWGLNPEPYKGLSDLVFSSEDKSRLLAAGLDGTVYIWDRRRSNVNYLELTTNAKCQLNSIELGVENHIVFGASRHGTIYAWDLRGGRGSFAFQSHNEVPLLTSFKISSMLEKIGSLKAQSNIVSTEVHSINFDPCCSYQLAFHLDDGWSGVLNVNTLSVTHVHCPPPAWLDGTELKLCRTLRRPTWLPTCSIYAVGSSSRKGLYLLDFYPHKSSSCHVDFNEELNSMSEESRGTVQNRIVPVSDYVTACAAHPFNNTIIVGTEQSSLLLLSQKHGNCEYSNRSP
ncbi:uncharacterized protein [Typha angustifolia]|uniref:uncharacterized protein isoform X1 n=1 Tax=Typha angustifolia TaxID=59011 RepID=UPI003C2B5A2D